MQIADIHVGGCCGLTTCMVQHSFTLLRVRLCTFTISRTQQKSQRSPLYLLLMRMKLSNVGHLPNVVEDTGPGSGFISQAL